MIARHVVLISIDGIDAGTSIPLLPPTAIAPLVASLPGLDFEAPDGTLIPGVLA